jgi:hypothetical protein
VLALATLVQTSLHLPAAILRESDSEAALARALTHRKHATTAADVHWTGECDSWLSCYVVGRHAVVRAERRGQLPDIYLVLARVSPEGNVIRIARRRNITETSLVAEQNLVASGKLAAWALRDGDLARVFLADVSGEPRPEGSGWTTVNRFQNALTNLQETGQFRGVGLRTFEVDAPAHDELALDLDDSALRVRVGERAHDVDVSQPARLASGPDAAERAPFREDTSPKARPGNLVTWTVDRLRDIPWIGSAGVQWIKAVAFWANDRVEQVAGTIAGDDGSGTVREEVGALLDQLVVEYTDPESGWPPAPVPPVLKRSLEGEGAWVSLDNDPFVNSQPGLPSPFAFTFLRADPARPYSQTFITMWDPRRVALHMVSGTVEPRSATGLAGTGLIPRDPDTLQRLVGAFNGGFQAIHGQFGMMADDVVYLPPKPYAATVTLERDGSTGFGTWPLSPAIPESIQSYRQNLSPLVIDGAYNPYNANWWGGVPVGWTDDSRTVRSGLCLTNEGFVGYFFGLSAGPEQLGRAMKVARCKYGVHLDMNAGHSGFEFYRVAPKGKLALPEERLSRLWQATGKVSEVEGYEFMARLMAKNMGLMDFPRYIHRTSRDFFYLTLRHVLPTPPVPRLVEQADPAEGEWRVKGLPHHGFPYAVATTSMHLDPSKPELVARLAQIDPKTVRPALRAEEEDKIVASFASAKEGDVRLWFRERRFEIAPQSPGPGALPITAGRPAREGEEAVAAIGIGPGGVLTLVDVEAPQRKPDPSATAKLLLALLERMGCHQRLLLEDPLAVTLGSRSTTPRRPTETDASSVVLVRVPALGAQRIFETTPILPPSQWAFEQRRPVPYTGRR